MTNHWKLMFFHIVASHKY